MPELPEVEITRRGIAPVLRRRTVTAVTVRNPRLRWRVPAGLAATLLGTRIRAVRRRAKYLLLDCGTGTLIVHLGMSGSLRLVGASEPPGPYDHFDLEVGDLTLRLRDPRRFGAVLWHTGDPARHPLLAHLGVEPLSPAFTGQLLHAATRGRRVAIKQALMDHKVVVGVGNIYASEALFRAGIHPQRLAGRIARARFTPLVASVRAVLSDAIDEGGTTLRNFVGGDGRPGYFRSSLRVYERDGQPCVACATRIQRRVIGQRASYYCPRCQR
jgi:formamidopyrimidine-DNA glycosylase